MSVTQDFINSFNVIYLLATKAIIDPLKKVHEIWMNLFIVKCIEKCGFFQN